MHNILFVDDELIYKLTIQNLVDWEKHGFSIIGTASNGEEALEFFKNNPVHAVITDLQMPIMDGITLIQELRKYGFAGPILALSNYSDYEYVRGALIAGAYDYLIKINITKEQVEKSLHQMSEMLASSPELQSSDTRLQEKSAFDQESLRLYTYLVRADVSWEQTREAICGIGPFLPKSRKAMGFHEDNTSPLCLLVNA